VTVANPFLGSERAKMRAVWRADPVLYVHQRFGAEPDPSQIELLEAFGNRDPAFARIATQSCAGTGKTTGLAWCTLNFMECWGDADNDPQGLAISITKDNLQDYFVKECAKWIGRAPGLDELLDLNSSRLAIRGRERTGFISFRSFPKNPDTDTIGKTLSGLHGRYIIQVLDEVGAMPPAVGRTADQAEDVDQEFFKILATGNPVSNDGLLFEIATNLRDRWKLIVVTGDPDDPKRSPRVPLDKARKAIAQYGRDAAWVRIYILGLFPLTALNKFLGPDDIRAAQMRAYGTAEYAWAQNRLGIDPARFGDDRTGFVRRQGRVMFDSQHLRGATSSQIAARAALLHSQTPFDLIIIDSGGPNSGGVFDQINKAGMPVIEVASSGESPDPRCFNLRAYMHWTLAQWVKTGGQLPKDEAMCREALAATYDFKNGRLIVEDKDDIKARLQASPDLWDSAGLTMAVPDAPKAMGLTADHPYAQAHALIHPPAQDEPPMQPDWSFRR
jgi:phage terminase large subunit